MYLTEVDSVESVATKRLEYGMHHFKSSGNTEHEKRDEFLYLKKCFTKVDSSTKSGFLLNLNFVIINRVKYIYK